MFEFLFDLPLLIAGPAIVGSLCLFALAGMPVIRCRVLPRLRIHIEDSEFAGAMLQSVMVFYGLAVALIAVSVFQTYSDASKIVSGEASALNALREYTDQVIRAAWPMQRQGKIPTVGFGHLNRFQAVLDKFEPTTDGQRLLHGETLRAYNDMIQAHRLRLDAASTGLPAVMWAVIIAGAFISLSASFFFKVEDARLHGILATLLAIFMGLVIFMIFALDRPFRGDLGLPADAYQLNYDQLMKNNP
jgi:hypothetical protein